MESIQAKVGMGQSRDCGCPLREPTESQFIYLYQLLFRPLLLSYAAFNSSYSYWF